MARKKCKWCTKGKLVKGQATLLMAFAMQSLLKMGEKLPRRCVRLHLAWLPAVGKDAKGDVYLECPCQRTKFPPVRAVDAGGHT